MLPGREKDAWKSQATTITREDLLTRNEGTGPSEYCLKIEKLYGSAKSDLGNALARLQELEEGQARIRLGYYKELLQLQDQLCVKRRDPKRSFEAISVRYFDVAEGLSSDIVEVLNTKLDQMKENYEEALHEKTIQTKYLEKRVHL